jgi:hypothetical protein
MQTPHENPRMMGAKGFESGSRSPSTDTTITGIFESRKKRRLNTLAMGLRKMVERIIV